MLCALSVSLLMYKAAFFPRALNVHRYPLFFIMATAFAIAIAIVGIYSQPNQHLPGTPQAGPGVEWSELATFFYYLGLTLFLLLVLLFLHAYFSRDRWSVYSWTTPLCLCIGTVATLFHHALWRSNTTFGVTVTALVITNIAVVLWLLNHLRAFFWGHLYNPDHLMLSPLEFFRLPNKALRDVLLLMQTHVNNPNATADEWRHFETVLLPRYTLATGVISFCKRGTLYPVLAAWFTPAIYKQQSEQARVLDDQLLLVVEHLRETQLMPVNSEQRVAAEVQCRAEFTAYVNGVQANMDHEEVHVYPLARRYIGAREANAMVRKSWDEVPPSRWAEVIPFIVHFLLEDRLRARWLDCFVHASPEHSQLVGKFLYENLDPFSYDRLVVDLPEMRPRMTRGYSRVW